MLNCRNLIQSHLEVIYMNQVLGDTEQATDRLLNGASSFKGYRPNMFKL